MNESLIGTTKMSNTKLINTEQDRDIFCILIQFIAHDELCLIVNAIQYDYNIY